MMAPPASGRVGHSQPPDAGTVRAMLAMLGLDVPEGDPLLPVLVGEMEAQVRFARLIDEALADTPAEAVADAIDTFDPAWPSASDGEKAS